ncbi:MAG: rRNA maturation RNase YbeY [Chloroflexota bacterium]
MSSQPGRQIEVSIAPSYRQRVSDEWLRAVVDSALQVALSPDQGGQVSLLVADDATVQGLNRQFRGLDEATDVLSFSPAHPGPWEGDDQAPQDRYLKVGEVDALPFVLPPDQPPMLGDIVISYPQARRQALARGEPVAKELAQLVVHGVLHLVGYDHQQPAEAALMQAREEAALLLAFSRQPVTPSPLRGKVGMGPDPIGVNPLPQGERRPGGRSLKADR